MPHCHFFLMMMNRQRRSLLKVVGITPAAASAGLAHAMQGFHDAPAAGGQLLLRHFARLQGESFHFGMNGAQSSAVLRCAEPLPGAADGEQNFRLVFAPAPAHTLAQGTWEVSHPALGRHAIFVSPNDARGAEVEAVFNRQG